MDYFTTPVIEAAWSDDHGATFNLVPLSGTQPGHFVTLCNDRTVDAPTYAAFMDTDSTFNRSDILVSKSSDGGATWQPMTAAVVGDAAMPPTAACAVRGDDVWVSYLHGIATISYDAVELVHSIDGAASWASPELVSQTSGALVHLPQIAMSLGGRVEIAWLEGMTGGTFAMIHASTVDGQTYIYEVIPRAIGPFNYRRDIWPWYGDYFGLASGPSWIWITYPYADVSDGTMHTDLIRRTAP